jgi:hypothetical protein
MGVVYKHGVSSRECDLDIKERMLSADKLIILLCLCYIPKDRNAKQIVAKLLHRNPAYNFTGKTV